MSRILTVCVVLLALGLTALAQPDPAAGGNQPGGQPGQGGGPGGFGGPGGGPGGGRMGNLLGGLAQANLVLEILPAGAFVLNNGVLAKFDPATLQAGGTLALFGPAPAAPQMTQNPTPEERNALRTWMADRAQRSAPAAVLAQDNRLYLILGTKYFCVDPETMKIDVQADLAAAPAGDGRNAPPMTKAELKLVDGVLYVVLAQELLTVDPATGKVAARAALPKEMFPMMDRGAFGGPGGNNPGGFGGGNRGGNNPGGGNRGGGRNGGNG